MGKVIMLNLYRSAADQWEVNRRLVQRQDEEAQREIDRLIGRAVDECRRDMNSKLNPEGRGYDEMV